MKALQILVGILLLFPGLCGTFFFGAGLLDQNLSGEARAYATLFSFIAVPAIQLGCLGLWLLSKDSLSRTLRIATRIAGLFGAFAAVSLLVFVKRISSDGTLGSADWIITVGIGVALAVIPFLMFGLPALLLKPEPERRAGS